MKSTTFLLAVVLLVLGAFLWLGHLTEQKMSEIERADRPGFAGCLSK